MRQRCRLTAGQVGRRAGALPIMRAAFRVMCLQRGAEGVEGVEGVEGMEGVEGVEGACVTPAPCLGLRVWVAQRRVWAAQRRVWAAQGAIFFSPTLGCVCGPHKGREAA